MTCPADRPFSVSQRRPRNPREHERHINVIEVNGEQGGVVIDNKGLFGSSPQFSFLSARSRTSRELRSQTDRMQAPVSFRAISREAQPQNGMDRPYCCARDAL